jgi:hypothetical protein
MERNETVELASGSLWLIAISAAFAMLSLYMIGTPLAMAVLLGAAGAALGLIILSVSVIRAAIRLPARAASTAQPRDRMRRQFIATVVGEVVALGATNVICVATGRVVSIPPLDLIIVGVHFFPLARIFRRPRYYAMGGCFCIVPILTMAMIPSTARVGQASAWFVVPSLVCSLWASATGTIGLMDARRAISN